MSMKDIKALYDIFEGTDIGEVEMQNGEQKLRFTISATTAPKTTPPTKSVAPPVSKSTTSTNEKTVTSKELGNIKELQSKWVGFFTRLNPKTSDYYLKLRDEVKKGQIIGHVRVLGVMQDVKSEINGKLKEILIEEGQPIEFGQPIMRFEI